MKKIISIILFLSGCAYPYGLSEEEYKLRKSQYEEVEKYTDCLDFGAYNELLNATYDIEKDVPTGEMGAYGPIYKVEYLEKKYTFEDILNTAKLRGKNLCKHVPWPDRKNYFKYDLRYDVTEKIAKKKIKEEEQKLRDENLARERKMAATEKKYGKKFCSEPVLNVYILRNMPIPSSCLVYSDNLVFRASQQTKDGTLVSVAYPQYFRNLLIVKNKKDSNLISGQNVPAGLFIGQGNYTYTTVLGAPVTVSKLKRLE